MSLADEAVQGEICVHCQTPFTEAHGYPVVCKECRPAYSRKELRKLGYQIAIHPTVKH